MSSQRKIYRLGKAPFFILVCAPLTIALSGLAEMHVNAIHQRALRDKAAMVSLGRELFNDPRLSRSGQQSCATCHPPSVSTTLKAVNNADSEFAPAIRYANYPGTRDASSVRRTVTRMWLQTMGMSSIALRNAIASAPYAARFSAVFGSKALTQRTPESVVDVASTAVAAYEASNELNPFDSKFDFVQAGVGQLTPEEARGLSIFSDPAKGNCATCHANKALHGEPAPLFANSMQSRLSADSTRYRDDQMSLSGTELVQSIPTLRNVAVRTRFFRDGHVRSLPEAVALSASLSASEVADVVAFLRTLTDGYDPVDSEASDTDRRIAQATTQPPKLYPATGKQLP